MKKQNDKEKKVPGTKGGTKEGARGLKKLNGIMGLALLGIAAATAFVYFTFAAVVTNMTDTMSNQATGATSMHTITFNLSTGNSFATGEQIAVDFPEAAAFVEGGTWAMADFSFSDGVARTIAGVNSGPGVVAVACINGPNNVGVALDTTALTFRVIPCGAAFVSSGMGAFVTFTINGVLPGGVLFNPAAQGQRVLHIVNGAGDCVAGGQTCGMAVAIVTSPSISVTATVASQCGNGVLNFGEQCDDGNMVGGDGCSAICMTEGGGGGGGGGGMIAGPDTTPPTISNVKTIAVTESCATFTWDTNEAANSKVSYGKTNTYGSQDSDFGYVVTHSRNICDFTIGTLYHYQVCSIDSANNQACSGDYTFKTLDETPPVLSAVTVSGISCSGATMNWTTDEDTSQFVDYGLVVGPPYTSTAGTMTPLKVSHSVVITGLDKKKLYHYRARSVDAGANEAFTSDASFMTSGACSGPDTTPPVITNVKAVSITGTTATITWDTDEVADSHVDYGKSVTYGGSAADATLVKSHSLALTGLTPSTLYHFQVTSADAAENTAISADVVFTTTAAPACKADCVQATFVPYIINPDFSERKAGTSFVLVDHPSAGLDRYRFEDKGVDIDYNDVVVDVNYAACGTVTFTTTIAPSATWHHQVRTEISYAGGLKKDVLLWGDSHAGVGHPVTISYENDQAVCAGTLPVISNVVVSDVTISGARVTWDTDRPTNSMVNYGSTTAYGNTGTDAGLTTSHLLILSGLASGTQYHFRARGSDSSGAVGLGADKMFTTVADTTPPANVTKLDAAPGNSHIVLTWTNPGDADFAGVKLLRKATGFPTGPNDGKLVYTGVAATMDDAGVTNGITYYYAAYAYDASGNFSSGAVSSATPVGPPDVKAPAAVTNLSAVSSGGQVLLEWVNPTSADFVGVKIIKKIGSVPTAVTDGAVIYDGAGTAFKDTKVTNDVLYFYAAYAYDAAGNYSLITSVSVMPTATVADKTPPGTATNLSAVGGDGLVQLHWTNPTDADWAGTRIVRKLGGAPVDQADGTVVFEGVSDNTIDKGVTNGVTYFYGAFAYDGATNYAKGVFASATPAAGLITAAMPCTDTDGGQNYQVKGTVTVVKIASGANATTTATTANKQDFEDNCSDTKTLHENYCENDTRFAKSYDCGAGNKCSAGACMPENFTPTGEKCGNGTCAENENSINCAVDCPIGEKVPPIVVKKVLVPKKEKVNPIDLRFSATAANIDLRMSGTQLNVYSQMSFTTILPEASVKKPVKDVYVNFAGSAYAMQKIGGNYQAAAATPADDGEHPLNVLIDYEDGTSDEVGASVVSVRRGVVTETVDGKTTNSSGTRVTLMVDTGSGNYGLWNGSASGQQNPQMTDSNGRYGFILPAGMYKLIAEKDGFLNKETLPFYFDSENVITQTLALVKLPPAIDFANPGTILENINFGALVVQDQAKEIVNNPIVQEKTKTIAVPTAVATAAANVASTGAVTAPYLLYVYSFLAHPTLLIARRRRKKWGIVYNSLSKLPVDLAIVRLLDAATGRIIRSAVTDKDGRYFFIVKAGEYKLSVVKAGFVFPSVFLRGKKEDALFVDLYHGEALTVQEETGITANIPLDPITVAKTPRKLFFEGIGRRIQKSMGVLSILAMVIAAIISPSPTVFTLLIVNVVMFVVFRRLAIPAKMKNWGIVYDEDTKKPVANAVARIFEAKYNKLLETQVTDSHGRYAFLVGKNVYYVTFEKRGYIKEQKGPIDLIPHKKKQKDGAQVVAVDVPISPIKGRKGGASEEGVVGSTGSGDVPPSSAPVAPAAPIAPPPVMGAAPPKAAASDSYAAQMLARLKKKPPEGK